MALRRITEPSENPISRDEAKLHLRVTDDNEDTLIDALIASATQEVEKILRRSLISQQWRLSLDRFPSTSLYGEASLQQRSRASRRPGHFSTGANEGKTIILDWPTIIDVDLVEYYDEDEVLQTLSSTKYDIDNENEPGRLVLKNTEGWPSTAIVPNAVKIEYTSGYGTASVDIPQAIRQAILITIGHNFENRESVLVAPGLVVAEVPRSVDWILQPYRVIEFV